VTKKEAYEKTLAAYETLGRVGVTLLDQRTLNNAMDYARDLDGSAEPRGFWHTILDVHNQRQIRRLQP
jgi:hypothetical protein